MIQKFDEQALMFIQDYMRNDVLTEVMQFFTLIGDAGAVWIGAGLILVANKKTRNRAIVALGALGITAVAINVVLKNIFKRPRPFLEMEEIVTLAHEFESYSFPSGHASSSIAMATALTMLYGKKAAWSFVPASLITFSRPYLGVHYVTDVVVGGAIGALCAAAVVQLAKKKTNLLK